MPELKLDATTLHYETTGDGYPILLLAPGGLRSSIPKWQNLGWDPGPVQLLAREQRVIAMDQRNAGESSGPITARDGWHTYTRDQLALLDHLNVDRCHLLGCCIGCSFILGLLEAAPARFSAATLLQPIGASDENETTFHELFAGWRAELAPNRDDVSDEDWAGFEHNLFGRHDFVFNVTRDFVRTVETPMLVMRGQDIYHPSDISREVAELAPNAQLVEHWKEEPARTDAIERMLELYRTSRN